MKKVYIIHTSLVSHDHLKLLFSQKMPDIELFNIMDDSLLHDVMKNGAVTPEVTGRVIDYCLAAERNGADLIFSQCSSVGKAMDAARLVVNVPIVKVDEAMAEKAVEMGSRIGVIATVQSTMRPSCDLVLEKAREAGKEVEIREYLVDGALDILMKEQNRKKHNELVLEKVKQADQECDVIVLAQGSMVVLLPDLKGIQTPILTSPEMGVDKAKKVLMEAGNE